MRILERNKLDGISFRVIHHRLLLYASPNYISDAELVTLLTNFQFYSFSPNTRWRARSVSQNIFSVFIRMLITICFRRTINVLFVDGLSAVCCRNSHPLGATSIYVTVSFSKNNKTNFISRSDHFNLFEWTDFGAPMVIDRQTKWTFLTKSNIFVFVSRLTTSLQ